MADKLDRFTQRARRALRMAHEETVRLHQGQIGPEHLLLGLIKEEGGVAGRVLRELGLEPQRVADMAQLARGPVQGPVSAEPSLGRETKRALELALDEARRMGHNYVGTEHILLGLAGQTKGAAIAILQEAGITPEQVRRHVRRVLNESPSPTVRRPFRAAARSGAEPLDLTTSVPAGHRPVRYLLSDYIVEALALVEYDKADEGTFEGRIPGFEAVMASAQTLAGCERSLRAALEETIWRALKLGQSLPVIAGLDLNRDPLETP